MIRPAEMVLLEALAQLETDAEAELRRNGFKGRIIRHYSGVKTDAALESGESLLLHAVPLSNWATRTYIALIALIGILALTAAIFRRFEIASEIGLISALATIGGSIYSIHWEVYNSVLEFVYGDFRPVEREVKD